ncbi:MAG: hypothetical protein LUC93_10490 [Planctomycetaceae bacterium]|nr:hypothetical protein [Planctomycetaceae bacterium]
MPIWMIMMGLQVIFFIVSAYWILSWMRGKADVYDEKLMESARKYMEEKEAQKLAQKLPASQTTSEGQPK